MGRRRRVMRWIASGLGVAALLLLIGLVGVQTATFKEWVRGQLVARAAALLDGDLRIERLRGTLWTGVTLERVQIWHRGRLAAAVDRVHVSYDPWTLLRGTWEVEEISIERAVVEAAENNDGWNLLQLIKEREPRTDVAPSFAIRRLRVSGATVAIAPRERAVRWLTDVAFDGGVAVIGGDVSLRVDTLRGRDPRTGLVLREFSGQATDGFRTFEAALRADSPATQIAGSVRGATTGAERTIDADLALTNVDVGLLLERPDLASDITGRLTARGSLPEGQPASATFTFSGGRTAIAGYTADALAATGRVDAGRVDFDATISAYGARSTAVGRWEFPTKDRAARLTSRGAFARVDLRRLPDAIDLPRLESNLAGSYAVTAGNHRWEANTTLAASTVEGAEISTGTTGRISAAGSTVEYVAAGTLSNLDVRRIGDALDVAALQDPRFEGHLNGAFEVSGRETGTPNRTLSATAVLEQSTLSGTRLPAMEARATLVDRRLDVEAHGEFEQLNAATLGLAEAILALNGRVDGAITIRDLDAPLTPENLEGDARVRLASSLVREVAIDEAVLDGQLKDGQATIRTLSVRSEAGTLDATGALALDHDTGAAITVLADVPDLAVIGRLLDRPLEGVATVEANVTGTLHSPGSTGALRLRQFKYGDVASALTSTAEFTAEWPERDLDRLRATVEGDATFVEVGGTPIQRVTATADGGTREFAVTLGAEQPDRALELEGLVGLQPESRALHLRRLALTTDGVAWEMPEGRETIVRHANNTVTVTGLALERGAQHIGVNGTLVVGVGSPVEPIGANGLLIEIRNVEIADVNRVLLGERELTGRLNGEARVTGNTDAPIVDADLVLRDGTVEGVAFASATARVGYADRRVAIDATLDQAPGVQLLAKGFVQPASPETGDGALDLTVSGGPIHLGLSQAFTTEATNVDGLATIDLRLTGSPAAPALHGSFLVSDGAFDLPATGARFRDIQADLAFEGSRLAIGRLDLAGAAGGRLTAEGGLDVLGDAAARGLDVRVVARNLRVLENQFGAAEVDADLRLGGTMGAPVLRGTATLASGRLEVARILERTTSTPYDTEAQRALSPEAEPETPPTPSLFDRADIAVRLSLPDNLLMRGRDLRVATGGFGIGDMNIVAGGVFDVTKPVNTPFAVLGTLEVVRGSYTFQGRRFEVARGSNVGFRGGPPDDPTLNVRATREVAGVTAEVRLRGTARSPEVALTSQPPLDEGDILSLIVFNQPINSLGAAERVNLGERAAALAAGAITTPLADSIAAALNLDLLEIQAPTSDDGTAAVSIGGRVGSRIFVGVRQQFGRDEGSFLSLEYRVNRMLRFVTSVAQGTLQANATRRVDQGGVDLLFVIRY